MQSYILVWSLYLSKMHKIMPILSFDLCQKCCEKIHFKVYRYLLQRILFLLISCAVVQASLEGDF